jgi:hypothetical protein
VTNLDLRPLSLGEILDRTFSLYRQNFWLLVGISALPQFPVLAVNLTNLWSTRNLIGRVTVVGSAPTPTSVFQSLGVGALIAIVFGAVAYLFTHGGTVFAVSELYLGRTATIGSSLRRVWAKFGKLLGVVLLNLAAVIVGLTLLILPGFYVACRLITCVPAALVEDLGPGGSIARSSRLTEGNVGKSFVIYLLYYCLLITAFVLVVYPFSYAAARSLRDPEMRHIWSSLGQLSSFVAGALVGPIFTISATVFYYDLRVRKEAFDLQLMMNQAGGAPAADRSISRGKSAESG